MSSVAPRLNHLMPRDDFANEITSATPQIKGIVGDSLDQVRSIIRSSFADVAFAYKNIGHNNVGSVALLVVDYNNPSMPAAGVLINGSKLRYANANGNGQAGARPTGTWRCLGYTKNDSSGSHRVALFSKLTD